MKANELVKAMGLNAVKQFLENDNIRTKEMHDELKRLVESYELINGLGGYEKAKLHLVATDKRLGYTHVYLHENGRYCWLDDYIDHIPFCAISIDSATKAIADVESVESFKEQNHA